MKSLFAVGMMIAAVPALAVAQNPFNNAKVGDWAEYKLVTTAQGVSYEAKLKTIVTAKEDKEVKIRSTVTEEFAGKFKKADPAKNDLTYAGKDGKEKTLQVDGGTKVFLAGAQVKIENLKPDNEVTIIKEVQSPESKIDLTKPYDPFTVARLPADFGASLEKDSNGKEKVQFGKKGKDDKEYDCDWQQVKMKGTALGMEVETAIKVWTSKDVPMSGMVKFEMKSKFIDTTMELIGSGKK